MARYDHGVKFDYTANNDGFVSHVARRGAEKTATGGIWFFTLFFAATLYLLAKTIIHTVGIGVILGILGVLGGCVLLLLFWAERTERASKMRKKAASPWIITYTCVDGQKVNAAARYVTKADALYAASRFGLVSIAGNRKPVRGYEAYWRTGVPTTSLRNPTLSVSRR